MDDSNQGVINFEMVGPNGNRWNGGIYVWGSQENGKILMSDMLYLSWVADYARRLKRPLEKGERTYALLVGRERDQELMESMGIKGMAPIDPDAPFKTWAELNQALRQRLVRESYKPPKDAPQVL